MGHNRKQYNSKLDHQIAELPDDSMAFSSKNCMRVRKSGGRLCGRHCAGKGS